MLGMTRGEIILTGIIVVLVFGWAWIPRIGEKIGSLFDRTRPDQPGDRS